MRQLHWSSPREDLDHSQQHITLCLLCCVQVGADKAIQIANYLCPGNYAVSGSIEGCEAVERLGKDPAFKARMTVSRAWVVTCMACMNTRSALARCRLFGRDPSYTATCTVACVHWFLVVLFMFFAPVAELPGHH